MQSDDFFGKVQSKARLDNLELLQQAVSGGEIGARSAPDDRAAACRRFSGMRQRWYAPALR